jgi:O-antigen ligase/tetratricopeptide (TPR) repeat protein
MEINKVSKRVDQQKYSFLFWGLIISLFLFLFYSPFHKGLFLGEDLPFEITTYTFIIFAAVFSILFSLYSFFHWKLDGPYVYSLLIWLLPLAYAISLMNPASDFGAGKSLIISVVYAIFFCAALFLTRNRVGLLTLQYGIVYSGFVIVIFGLLNLFGNLHAPDAVMMTVDGIRLASVFQYPNTYAAYLTALLLSVLLIVSSAKSPVYKLLHSVMLVPIFISFLLTLSRGGLIVFPLIVLIVLFLIPISKQIATLINIAITTVISFVSIQFIYDSSYQLQNSFSMDQSLKNWALLLLLSMINGVICYYCGNFVEKLVNRKSKLSNLKIYVLPVVLILFTLVASVVIRFVIIDFLPDNLKNRIESVDLKQVSVVERFSFFKDALKIASDYPLTGAGGGGWKLLYEQYQETPYVSNQIHSYYFQTLVEVGFLGVILIAILFLVFFYKYLKNYVRFNRKVADVLPSRLIFFIFPLSILVHSLIDFDMSFAYIGFLVFLCFGGMLGDTRTSLGKLTLSRSLEKYRFVFPAIVLIISIIMLFSAVKTLKAFNYYEVALNKAQTQNNLNEIIDPLNKAIELRPEHVLFNSLYTQVMTQVFSQTKDPTYFDMAETRIQESNKHEPNNKAFLHYQIDLNKLNNNLEEALSVANRSMSLYPWDISFYEQTVLINYQIGEKFKFDNDTENSDKYWNAALAVWELASEKNSYLQSLSIEESKVRHFDITANMGLNFGKIYYYNQDFEKAANTFRIVMNRDRLEDNTNQELAIWYLLSQKQIGQFDNELYAALVKINPDVEDFFNN